MDPVLDHTEQIEATSGEDHHRRTGRLLRGYAHDSLEDERRADWTKGDLQTTGRSTAEQIFYVRILCEKYLQHQQDL